MRLCILLRKSLLQMILQTYLNYCTHFKYLLSKTTTILESWILLTVWPASSSQQSVLPLISLVVFLLYVSGDVVTS